MIDKTGWMDKQEEEIYNQLGEEMAKKENPKKRKRKVKKKYELDGKRSSSNGLSETS